MHVWIRSFPRPLALLATVAAACALGACGSDTRGQATTLLKQTFSGTHKVDSGNVSVALTVNPSGSSLLSGPITLTIGGPFQGLGTGKLPESDFTINVSALGKGGSLSLISTGSEGFVSLQGVSYRLPNATFQKLESSFAGLAASGGGSGGGLGKLGIDPLKWLTHPSVAGNDTVGGAATTHIKAGVDVPALVRGVSTLLSKAASLGVPSTSVIPTSLSAATQSRIASEVQNPTVDVWTGTADKTARKLAINLTLPVPGQISTALGGLSSAGIGLSVQYSELNQPQTITAPTNIRPFSEFTAKLKAVKQTLQGLVGSGLGGGSTSTATIPSPTGGNGGLSAAPSVRAYSQCIQSASGDITKMQKCASLLTKK